MHFLDLGNKYFWASPCLAEILQNIRQSVKIQVFKFKFEWQQCSGLKVLIWSKFPEFKSQLFPLLTARPSASYFNSLCLSFLPISRDNSTYLIGLLRELCELKLIELIFVIQNIGAQNGDKQVADNISVFIKYNSKQTIFLGQHFSPISLLTLFFLIIKI